jgi:hypothetical protein
MLVLVVKHASLVYVNHNAQILDFQMHVVMVSVVMHIAEGLAI